MQQEAKMVDDRWPEVEERIVLVYRRKGERHEHDFSGPVGVLGEDRQSIAWLRRADLPISDGRLDLTRVPVVGIAGKSGRQQRRVREFLKGSPSFQGVVLVYPPSGAGDASSGRLLVTSQEILSGRPVSGGTPEVQLTNYRWLRDGRYVADRARMLHGKVIETLESELEQQPGVELIARAIMSHSFEHALHGTVRRIVMELGELEQRRALSDRDTARNVFELVHERLREKLAAAGVRKVVDIPADFTLSADEVAPELIAGRETLGTIEIPGVGRRHVREWSSSMKVVELSIAEFRQVSSWPFTDVHPVLTELGREAGQIGTFLLQDAIDASEGERLAALREHFSSKWLEAQRHAGYPQSVKVVDPFDADPPSTPEPVEWGFDLMTGEALVAHAALVHGVGDRQARLEGRDWFFQWRDDPFSAAETDAESRQFAAGRARMAGR